MNSFNKNTEEGFNPGDDLFEYSNSVANYHIQFVHEKEISAKCEIVCSAKNLWQELTKIIDSWLEPYEMDILDVKATVFEKVDFGGDIFFLSSYLIRIGLGDTEPTQTQAPSSDILVPFFEFKPTGSRKLKSFKGYSS